MIKITNLSKVFNKNKDNACVALDNLSLEIQDGELLAITGKSGSGKSTLLHILCGLIGDFSGEVLVNDINLANLSNSKLSAYRAKNIGIVMQDFYLIEECSVLDNVRLPLNFTKGSNKAKTEKATSLIYGVGLEKYLKKTVGDLSGGEKQRVAIARALVNDTNLILCDEPTGALDSKNSQLIMDMLKRLNQKGKTLVVITHNPEIANQCKRIIEISDGKIISDTRTDM